MTEDEFKIHFGAYIMSKRRILKMSAKELARQIGVTTTTISKIECGISVPKAFTAFKIARALGFSLDRFSVLEMDPNKLPSQYPILFDKRVI